MSVFSDFSLNLQSDPQFRKKVLVFVVGSVGLLTLIGLMVWVNFGQRESQNPQPTPAPQNETPLAPAPATVDTNSFDQANELERVDNELVQFGDSVYVDKDNKIGFINEKGFVRFNQKTVQSPFGYGPSKINFSLEGLVINEPSSSSYLKQDNTIVSFPNGVIHVLPATVQNQTSSTQIFYSLTQIDGKIALNQASNISLSDSKKIVDIVFGEGKVYFMHELRQIANQVYLVSYESLSKTGVIDVYSLQNGKLELALGLKDVESIQIGQKEILVTDLLEKPTELTIYRNSVYDFSGPKPTSKPFDITKKLGTDNIYGNIFARRCAFDAASNLYCLVKKQKTGYTESGSQDVIVKTNLKSNKSEYLLSGNIFSGSFLIVSPSNDLYMVGQENRILYKVKTTKS